MRSIPVSALLVGAVAAASACAPPDATDSAPR
jgi:hypothetical protein